MKGRKRVLDLGNSIPINAIQVYRCPKCGHRSRLYARKDGKMHCYHCGYTTAIEYFKVKIQSGTYYVALGKEMISGQPVVYVFDDVEKAKSQIVKLGTELMEVVADSRALAVKKYIRMIVVKSDVE